MEPMTLPRPPETILLPVGGNSAKGRNAVGSRSYTASGLIGFAPDQTLKRCSIKRQRDLQSS